MTSIFHAASGLETALAWMPAAWTGASELITVSVVLLALDKLAGAIRTVYAAGQWTRRLVDAM